MGKQTHTLVFLLLLLFNAKTPNTAAAPPPFPPALELVLVHRDHVDSPFRHAKAIDSLTASPAVLHPNEHLREAISHDSNNYLVRLALGSPPVSFFLRLDVSSALTWVQCPASNGSHPNNSGALFDPSTSSSWRKLPRERCARPLNRFSREPCSFMVSYGDHYAAGVVSTEVFGLRNGQGDVSQELVFGCAHQAGGAIPGPVSGVLGLAPVWTSFAGQLSQLRRASSFSYCLIPMRMASTGHNFLRLGPHSSVHPASRDDQSTRLQYWATNLHPGAYFLTLLGISIGGQRLKISKSAFERRGKDLRFGGTVVGTSERYTKLSAPAYDMVKKHLVKTMGKMGINKEAGRWGLELCFSSNRTFPVKDVWSKLSAMTLHLQGADLSLLPRQLYAGEGSVVCLAMVRSEVRTTLGTHQQGDMRLTFNLAERLLTFRQENCSAATG